MRGGLDAPRRAGGAGVRRGGRADDGAQRLGDGRRPAAGLRGGGAAGPRLPAPRAHRLGRQRQAQVRGRRSLGERGRFVADVETFNE